MEDRPTVYCAPCHSNILIHGCYETRQAIPYEGCARCRHNETIPAGDKYGGAYTLVCSECGSSMIGARSTSKLCQGCSGRKIQRTMRNKRQIGLATTKARAKRKAEGKMDFTQY